MNDLRQRLDQRRQQYLFRQRQIMTSPQGIKVATQSGPMLSFCSNDYLGLANDPRVAAALKAGVDRYGVGAGASHLISGHSAAHHVLEQELAEFVGASRALLFSTGYMANLAVTATLLKRHDQIFEDRLNHASLLDGARVALANIKRYRHADADHLQSRLAASGKGQKMVLSDGVFSMDGDLMPLAKIHDLTQDHDAWLLVDDAHGFGVIGNSGRGSFEVAQVNISGKTMLMATLGKGFGTFGAFVAGDADVIELLIQEARTYIYTTAMPPALAEATRASLRIIQQEPERRQKLKQLITQFRRGARELGLQLMDSTTAIQPVILGDARQALAASEQLQSHGIWVSAIRPPTVPAHTARLRITLSALHEPKHVEQLLDALADLKQT